MWTGTFPLDEDLDLGTSGLTPHAQECLVRLAGWEPFAPAAQLLEGVPVSKSSVRQLTLQAGEAGLAEWDEHTTALQHAAPGEPAGDERRWRQGTADEESEPG